MKLYTTPPSILTLVTWVPQSMLAFGQIESYSIFLLSPARILDGRAWLCRAELTYSLKVFDICGKVEKVRTASSEKILKHCWTWCQDSDW